jgi:hypothetical protein
MEPSVVDRAVRNLAYLQQSASTSRVLNLHAIGRKHGADPQHTLKPLFKHPLLNRGIYIKHRVRPNEVDLFDDRRTIGTKVLLPLDPRDLRSGGRYVFVGERAFDTVIRNMFGDSLAPDTPDRRMLDMIDEIPSLDPFLLREHLRRNGREAAPCYWDLSEADLARIFSYVQEQVEPLVALSLADAAGAKGDTGRLVTMMLSGSIDSDLEPLRLVLNLAAGEFAEGVFCWKGFLYYKWALREVMRQVPRVSREILEIKAHGSHDIALRAYILTARDNLQSAIADAGGAVADILDIYDRAFAKLVEKGDPQAFRDFLLAAPGRFVELGDRLGAINHLVSFWSFRFPATRRAVVTTDELADIFLDFENGLTFNKPAFAMVA